MKGLEGEKKNGKNTGWRGEGKKEHERGGDEEKKTEWVKDQERMVGKGRNKREKKEGGMGGA